MAIGRTVDQQLLRHAAADHAGAAVTVFLGHRDARAMARGDPAGAHAARSATDHEEVEVILAHRGPVLPHTPQAIHAHDTSEARRVGKECVSTFRSRWSPDP